ncbi:MAG: hypothetical protein K2K12_05440, partial [Clostridia bacterium]|nr:hypothetical protein [Clostridia bacterium]
MAGYDFELSKGSPKQWVKKTLPLFLIKRIFFGIIVGVASLTIWGLIFIILRLNRNSKKRNIKGEGACPNTFSLSFGVNNASDFHLGNGFRFFYSLIFLLIGAASIVAIIVLSGIELILGIFFSIGILVYVLYQIYGVFTFQNLIKKYACPQCGMA